MILVGLLPIVTLLALGIIALAVWALIRAIKEKRKQGRISVRHAVVLMVCCTILWLGISFFFLLRAALGHSAHPLLDAWPACLVGFLVLIVAPVTMLVGLARRKSG
jgi:hypothetical protein